MTRRDASWLIARAAATAGAAAFLTPWLANGQKHEHSTEAKPPADPHNWKSYQPKFFSQEEFVWIGWYTAILIPTDDTPGAREAQVTTFIDFVVNAAADMRRKYKRSGERRRTGCATTSSAACPQSSKRN